MRATLMLAGGVVLVGALAVAFAATLFGTGDASAAACSPDYEPSRSAVADIPDDYLALYASAAEASGVDWAYLAAIGSIESDHGRLKAAGVRSGANGAGAQGPMQFLASTWVRSGVDGNGDGRRDPYEPADAIPAAAAYLVASGAPDDYGRALFAYNRASWYVADVRERASRYRGAAGGEASDACGAALAVGQGNGRDVLSNPRIEIYPGGQADLRAGVIDARVTALLEALARSHTLTVTSLTTGHSLLTRSGNRSNHADGRAVDIGAVDGTSCKDTARSSPCGQVAMKVARITGAAAPSEVIYCFDPGAGDNSFAAADHCDHSHIAYRGGP